MSKNKPKALTPEEYDVWKKYHKRGCSQFVKPKLDQVCLDVKTTKEHKLAILGLATRAVYKDEHFVTEAVPNDRPKRRVDFVNLTKDEEFEVETNRRVKKDGATTIYTN